MKKYPHWLPIILLVFITFSCKTNENMTVDDIHNLLKEGMTRSEVESFFDERGIDYLFISREDDQLRVPKFPWKTKDALGYYGAVIRDVRTVWWKLSSEHIQVQVEIDSEDKASQIIVKKAYTAP